jgi:hypothetical protein
MLGTVLRTLQSRGKVVVEGRNQRLSSEKVVTTANAQAHRCHSTVTTPCWQVYMTVSTETRQ